MVFMISLIIPAYNEEKILPETVRIAQAYLQKNFDSYEIIIANDGSTDATAALFAQSDTLRVVGYSKNRGKGYAVKTGMLAARGDILFYTDADLAYGVEVIAPACALLKANHADAVIGSRRMDRKGYESYPLLRRLASYTFHRITAMVSGCSYDSQCGFKGFRREAAQKIFSVLETERFAFDVEVMLLAQQYGLSIVQFPVSIINHRESKINVVSDSIHMLRDMIKIRKSVAQRFAKRG